MPKPKLMPYPVYAFVMRRRGFTEVNTPMFTRCWFKGECTMATPGAIHWGPGNTFKT